MIKGQIWKRAASMCAAGILTLSVFGREIVYAAATEEEDDLRAYMTEYYEAYYAGDVERLEELNPELSDDDRILVQINPKTGVEGLADLELTIYPMKGTSAFLVGAYYTIRVEGIDAGVPGYVLSLAERVEGGGWRLNHDEDFNASWEEYIEESDLEDIYTQMEACNEAYQKVRSEEPGMAGWLNRARDAMWDLLSGNNEKTYIVVQGDTLWGIAEKQLGDGMRFMELYEPNRKTIGDDPGFLLPGMELILPM